MTKNDVHKAIDMLQNDEEIESFVKLRIQELEDNSVETTVGQNYTTTFREYISQKTHYKPGERLKDAECPDLVYDDLTPYIELVKKLENLFSEGDEDVIENEIQNIAPYTEDNFLEEVYMNKEDYNTLVSLLKRKKNIIR